jgi:RNA polymerase sigma factor (sigma-70 family)
MENAVQTSMAESDLALLDRCLDGDRKAREDLAVRIGRLVFMQGQVKALPLGLRLSRADLEDLSHDILVSLFEDDCRRLRAFGRRSSLSRWVAVIVANRLIDTARRNVRTLSLDAPVSHDPDAAVLADVIPDPGPDPRERAVERSLVEAVREARATVLSREENLILDLWCSREYTEREMGVLLGRNPNTIATIISRAQAKILQYLRDT